MTTRAEHMAWCKQRALAELDAGGERCFVNALASMASDLNKHDETRGNSALGFVLTFEGARIAALRDEDAMRHFIDGFAE